MRLARTAAVSAAAALLALGSAGAQAAGRLATGADPLDPYAGQSHGLHFGDLEYAMPSDPLLWESDPGWGAHHTPERYLAPAVSELKDAIPAGTSAETAIAVLRKAGAHCHAVDAAGITCRYQDIATPTAMSRYTDDVIWRVQLALAGGRVSDLTVTRDWSRH